MKKIILKLSWISYLILSGFVELLVLSGLFGISFLCQHIGWNIAATLIQQIAIYGIFGLPFLLMRKYKKKLEKDYFEKEKLYKLKNIFWLSPNEVKGNIKFEKVDKISLEKKGTSIF